MHSPYWRYAAPFVPLEDAQHYRRYVRGNDYSPVAVAIILNCEAEKIPRELENLARAGVESGAALSGTVQTEKIGFEKIVCNIVLLCHKKIISDPFRTMGSRQGSAPAAAHVQAVRW